MCCGALESAIHALGHRTTGDGVTSCAVQLRVDVQGLLFGGVD